ncbi:GYDIA family GHMP kinase [uncultured Flavobacterium sp.]|uniref:GYDIA family GHMP kinase n=1 Tax=uncultured Flavobacterium sp. TaxID=165435 RepID=UPI0030ECC51E|tara:strand:- start:84585 stop:85502 length:918 start_codon:yes stop_codon:yes gene_type:complete
MKETFYSNGKLLITGEYLVLDGAKAFALPTKFGQNLTVEKSPNHKIHWKSFDSDGQIWFEDTILFSEIINPELQEPETIKSTLLSILHEGYVLNPSFIKAESGYIIITQLSFPKKWGLGTSSTLINNIAQWLQIDAFTLLNNSFGGSGYDIACAQNNNPILFHLEKGKPIVEKTTFKPDFSQHIYFVYLNKKQSSKTAIANYQTNKTNNLNTNIDAINKITLEVLHANSLHSFAQAIEKHENKMSIVLKTTTVKEALFSDFNGEVKSLGAWGGDFIMAISESDPTSYFSSKGFDTIIPYNEMILS